MKRTATGRLAAVLLVCAALLLSACSSAAGGGGSGNTSQSFLHRDTATVATLFHGTDSNPPRNGPAAKRGMKVWIISYGQSYGSAAYMASAAQRAAQALGWNATVYDAKFDPSNAVAGMRQAVAAGAKGIFDMWFDCSSIKAGLLAARQAGVFVVADEVSDCQGSPLFDYVTQYHPGTFASNDGSLSGYLQGWGAALASYAIDKTDGKAKVLIFNQTDASAFAATVKGAKDRLAECAGCEVAETIDFTGTDIGPSLQQKTQQALLQHPEANAIFAPGDGILTGGVLAALRASGKYGSMVIAGGEGSTVVQDLRQYSGHWAVSELPLDWSAYQDMDALNRLFAGDKPVADSGIGYQLVDKDHNLPSGDHAIPMQGGAPLDFAALYGTSWKQ